MKTLLFFLLIFCLQGCGIKVDVGSSAIVSDAVPAPSLLTLVTPTSNISFVDTPMVTVSGVTIGDTITVYSDNCLTAIGTQVAVATSVNITTNILPEGIYSLRANATRDGVVSSCSTSSLSYTVDTTAPTVLSVDAPDDDSYTVSENLNFIVLTSQAVTVTTTGGTPRITLNIGGTTRYATFVSGSGSTTLTFRYTVQAGENDSNGITVSSPIDLNSGSITDVAQNALTLNFSAPVTTDVLVDNTAPTILSVTPPGPLTYALNQNLDFYVNTSEAVTVVTTGGTPRIALDIGGTTRYAAYYAGSGTDTLTFRYTIQAGEMDADGIVVSQPVQLNSGTIRDAVALNFVLTFAVPNTASVLVDSTATAPTVTSISPIPVDATYLTNPGVNLDFTVNFSENVTVTGVPALTLELDGINRRAVYVSGTTTNALLFRYTTEPSDSDINGIALNSNWDFTLGSLANAASVSVSTSIPAPTIPNLSSVLINQSPDILSVTIEPGTYTYNQNLDVSVKFSEVVTGLTTRLAFDIGGTTVYADYLSGSGTNLLVYRWTNVGGLTDHDGITLISPIDLNGGTLRDSVTNDAVLTFGVPDLSGVLVDGTLPPTGLNYYGVSNFTLMPGGGSSNSLYPSVTGGDLPSHYTINSSLQNIVLDPSTGEIAFINIYVQNASPITRIFTGSNSGGSDTVSLAITSLPIVEKNKIAIGEKHTCAIASGGVYCWGDNTFGQRGDGLGGAVIIGYSGGALQTIAPGSGIKLISAAANDTCIVNAKTNIVCWGQNYGTTPTPIPGRSSDNESVDYVSHISVGPNHSCYLRFGKAYCWGANTAGQLGDGTNTSNTIPQLVAGHNLFDKISVGSFHTCALSGKKMYCWGSNSRSQLGDGTATDSNVPVLARDAHDIAVGDLFSCALYGHRVYCWGENSGNRLGRDTTTPGFSTVALDSNQVTMAGVSKISIHPQGDFVFVIKFNGEAWGWGNLNKFLSGASTAIQNVVNIGSYVAEGVAGFNNLFYLKADPSLNVKAGWFGVGAGNSYGELGTGSAAAYQDNKILNLNANASFTGLRAGAESTCVHVSSTPHCFGSNASNELTTRTLDLFLPLNNVFDSLYDTNIGLNEKIVTDSVHGRSHSCYSSGPDILCAGRDSGLGELGDGGIGQPYTDSVLVGTSLNSKKMCAGISFTCTLSYSGNVQCWGDNGMEQIAVDPILNPSYSSPVPVISSLDVTDIACLANSLCFIKDDQKIYCQGEIVSQGTPIQILDLVAEKFIKIKAGAQFFCAQTNTGKLYCTGDNSSSQLGASGASTNTQTGSLVMSNGSGYTRLPVLDFGVGSAHACANTYDTVSRKTQLWCWGDDTFGQVSGLATGAPSDVYLFLNAVADAGEIVAGDNHTCVQYSGGVSCWGKASSYLGFDFRKAPNKPINAILPFVYR